MQLGKCGKIVTWKRMAGKLFMWVLYLTASRPEIGKEARLEFTHLKRIVWVVHVRRRQPVIEPNNPMGLIFASTAGGQC
jgi:hypothetical protein